MWNVLVNLDLYLLSFKSTVKKEHGVHWWAPEICSSAIQDQDMPSYAIHSCTSSACCHHAERILARSVRAGNWNLWWSHHHLTPLQHKLSVALSFFLMAISHTLGQHTVNTRTENSLSRPTLHQVHFATARVALRVPAPQMLVPATHAFC